MTHISGLLVVGWWPSGMVAGHGPLRWTAPIEKPECPYNGIRVFFRDEACLHGRECHYSAAAGGGGGDASLLDGAFRECFVDPLAGAAGTQGRGPCAGDAG